MDRIAPILIGLMLFLSSCSLTDGQADGIAGHVSFGFEQASFTACGGEEPWWIGGGEASAELQERYQELDIAAYGLAFARIKGETSGRGAYGHLGAYEREIDVTEVLEVRGATTSDC